MCLALAAPELDVLAVTATGGNVPPDQATRNVQAIVEQLDPPRWPRLGAASSDQMLRTDARHLFGADGLCGAHFPVPSCTTSIRRVKVICDEVRAAPGDVTIIAPGPLSNIAAALQQQPDLASLIGHLIILGGTRRRAGQRDAGGRVQHLLRRRSGPRRVSLASHQDADSDRRHDADPVRLRPAGEDPRRRVAGRQPAASGCCPARFAPIASSSGSKASTCTTRWRWSPRCTRSCSRPSECTATWKPTARSRTARRCSTAAAIRRAGRIWTWPSTSTRKRWPTASYRTLNAAS